MIIDIALVLLGLFMVTGLATLYATTKGRAPIVLLSITIAIGYVAVVLVFFYAIFYVTNGGNP